MPLVGIFFSSFLFHKTPLLFSLLFPPQGPKFFWIWQTEKSASSISNALGCTCVGFKHVASCAQGRHRATQSCLREAARRVSTAGGGRGVAEENQLPGIYSKLANTHTASRKSRRLPEVICK